ncbi:MAG: SMP-30/gluconolactonase/LRE family protein [Bacteroidota bacterium]
MKLLKYTLVILVLLFFSFHSYGQYYQAKDLTSENLFTENIEGSNVDKKGNLFVVNFQKDGTIGLVNRKGKVTLFVTLPEGSIANAIMFDADDNLLLADWTGHNVLKVNKKTKAISTYCHNDHFNQPNDLCINKKGQLFASDPNWKESTGKLWRIDTNGEAVLLAENMGTTNGIELSPDEKILYVNESVQRKIWSFDVNEQGDISNKRLVTEFEDFGFDGMKCDLQGNLYVTRHGKGTIAIIEPDGELFREVELKGKKVSNIIFGGKDGRTCYVTLQDRKCVETFRSEIPGRRWR